MVTFSQIRRWFLLPIIGIGLFIMLYLVSAFLYPGGSQIDHHSAGFSWIHNYWCDLLSTEGYNGRHNPGRKWAMGGMASISVALASFWILFPIAVRMPHFARLTMQFAGATAMIVALFLSTRFHDEIIYASSGLGLVAMVLTFIGLRRLQWNFLLWFGIVNLIIFFIDHYIYYSQKLVGILPIVQKINFAGILLWFLMISFRLYRNRIPL